MSAAYDKECFLVRSCKRKARDIARRWNQADMLSLRAVDLNSQIAGDVQAARGVNGKSVLSAFGLREGTAISEAAVRLDVESQNACLRVGDIERSLIRAEHDSIGAGNIRANPGKLPGGIKVKHRARGKFRDVDAAFSITDNVRQPSNRFTFERVRQNPAFRMKNAHARNVSLRSDVTPLGIDRDPAHFIRVLKPQRNFPIVGDAADTMRSLLDQQHRAIGFTDNAIRRPLPCPETLEPGARRNDAGYGSHRCLFLGGRLLWLCRGLAKRKS